MRVVSLASGSSGNALLVQSGETAVLIDAGIPGRTLLTRMRQAGCPPERLSAILLTHEHHDHTVGACALATRLGIPIVTDPRTIGALLAQSRTVTGEVMRQDLPVGRSTRIGALEVRSFPISHDAAAPCGFVLASASWRMGVVTDSGELTGRMVEELREAHLLVVEANHDRELLLAGPYPTYLKRRILGPTGHLSNAQTSEGLLRLLDDAPRWIWLAHLSRTNNTPDLARTHIADAIRQTGLAHEPVALPPQLGPEWNTATLWGATQLTLAEALPAETPAVPPQPRHRHIVRR